MKKFLLFVVVSLLALVLVACGGDDGEGNAEGNQNDDENESASENEDAKVIRAGIGLNQDHPQYKGLLKFKEIVEEETDGAIEVETYHSGQLGDDRSMTEDLQLGSQEVTIPSTAPLANFVPEFSVFDIPFLFPDEETADKVLADDVAQGLLEKLEEKDLVGLAYWENGFRDLTNSERPVETIEDFDGLDIRTMENDLHLEAFKELGSNPTPMAFTELFTALQQGTVDGQENPYATIYLENFYEVQDYVSDTHHVYSPFVFLMSKQFYDGLTEEQQEIVREAAQEAGEHQIKLNREANEEYLQSLIDEGMEFSEISDEEREKMVEAVQPVIEDFKDDIGAETVDGIYEDIEKALSE